MAASNLDETLSFQPRFDAGGLIPAIVADAGDGTILMFAYMNAEALRLTRETGLVHFWSRSRRALWRKGETSGESFEVRAILVDCDQDVLLVKVAAHGRGNACHTGRRSCFYRVLSGAELAMTDTPAAPPRP